MRDSLVIIPTYNEHENVSDMINAIFSISNHVNILVVDDNSPDGTSSLVMSLQKKYTESLFLLNSMNKTLSMSDISCFTSIRQTLLETSANFD